VGIHCCGENETEPSLVVGASCLVLGGAGAGGCVAQESARSADLGLGLHFRVVGGVVVAAPSHSVDEVGRQAARAPGLQCCGNLLVHRHLEGSLAACTTSSPTRNETVRVQLTNNECHLVRCAPVHHSYRV
jgi:hypothetical protein